MFRFLESDNFIGGYEISFFSNDWKTDVGGDMNTESAEALYRINRDCTLVG